jgi:hypothetical protein
MRKTAAVVTYYVEEMKEANKCMINNIKEPVIYEEQVQSLTTPTALMAHAIPDQENPFQQLQTGSLVLTQISHQYDQQRNRNIH